MDDLNPRQRNVLEALIATARRRHAQGGSYLLPHTVLACYDGRTVNALIQRGHIVLLGHEAQARVIDPRTKRPLKEQP